MLPTRKPGYSMKVNDYFRKHGSPCNPVLRFKGYNWYFRV